MDKVEAVRMEVSSAPPFERSATLSCLPVTRGWSFQKMAQFAWDYYRQNLVNADIQNFVVKYTSLCQMPALRFKSENFLVLYQTSLF